MPAFHICVQANYNTANKARDISLATTYFLATSLFAIIIPTIQYAEQSSFMHEAIFTGRLHEFGAISKRGRTILAYFSLQTTKF